MKHTELASGYKPVPEDPTIYTKQSLMKEYPEVTLWDFIENRPDLEYEKFAYETGHDLSTEHNPVPLAHLNLVEQDFIEFMLANQDTCQKKYYEKRPYHSGTNELTMNLPMKLGYNHRNTIEYNWGLYGDSNEQLKELLGGRKVFEEQIGIDYDTALLRLLAYLPGQVLPLHLDFLGNWCRDNQHLNPDINARTCDLGEIKRYLVMITDWHWGHALQYANSWFPRWKSGEVYDLPMGIYHISANIGIKLKLSCSISGAKIK